MSRYVIGVDVQGNAVTVFQGMAPAVHEVLTEVGGLNTKLGELDGAVDKMAGAAKMQMLSTMSGMMSELSAKVEEMTGKLIEGSKAFISSIVSTAAQFQDSESEMVFAFGSDWQNVYAQVKADAARLTFTFRETVELATSLGRMKINPFGGTKAEDQEFLAKTGQKIRALDVLQDTADATGKGVQDIIVSIRNAMAGQWKSIEDRLDIPKEKIKEWRKEIEKTHDKQKQFNLLVGDLAGMFGGAGALKAQNFNKQLAQIPDLLEQIRAEVGKGALKPLTGAMQELIASFGSLLKNKEVMAALGAGFTVVGNALAFVVHVGAGLIDWFTHVIELAPWLPKLAGYMFIVAVAGGVLVGTALAMTAGIMAVGLAIAMVGGEAMLAGAALAVFLIPALIVVGAAAGVFFMLMKVGAEVMTKQWSGVGSAIDKIRITFQALQELVSSYNGITGKMSIETAEKLKKAGMYEFVKDTFKVFHRLNVMWGGFMSVVDQLSDRLGGQFAQVWYDLREAFWTIVDALGLVSDGMDAAASGSDEWGDSGERLGDVLANLMELTLTMISGTARLVTIGVRGYGRMAAAAELIVTPFLVIHDLMTRTGSVMDILMSRFSKMMQAAAKLAPALGLHIDPNDIPTDPLDPKNKKTTNGNVIGGMGENEKLGKSGYNRRRREQQETTKFNEKRERASRDHARTKGYDDRDDADFKAVELARKKNPGAHRNNDDTDVPGGRRTERPDNQRALVGATDKPQGDPVLHGKIDALIAAVKAQKMEVNLDGHQIATSVSSANDGVAGRHG